MSDLAEYARRLHESGRRVYERTLTPMEYRCGTEALTGVRAVIVDVYGTLVNYWRPGFETRETRELLLLEAFADIIGGFGMADTIRKMNPAAPPAETLRDFYNGLIALNHEKSASKGAAFPEVRIEEVWSVILMMLKRNGYDAKTCMPPPSADARFTAPPDDKDLARYLTYTYNFLSMGRQLYPGVADALRKLKSDNIVLGIVADAQLYTPVDLTLLLRDQSGGTVDDYNELFDPDLTFFSYEYGFVKPSEVLYRRLFDALYEYRILPSQTVFIGNDLLTDIRPAAMNGMKTGLFCGDGVMVLGADGDGGMDGNNGVTPDIVFNDWAELPRKLSFHGV